ncbi:MAG TPA: hypothetical protein DEA55_07255 [Rhodospirillaceae bacterium]|nr:hypothetical protein [Rhodospirillaceae bacterium]
MMVVRRHSGGVADTGNSSPFNAVLGDVFITANKSNGQTPVIADIEPWYPAAEGKKAEFNETVTTICANLHTNIVKAVDSYLEEYSKSTDSLTNRQIKDKINGVLVDCVQSACRLFSETHTLHLKGINAGKIDTDDLGRGVVRFRTKYADKIAGVLGKKISAEIDATITDIGNGVETQTSRQPVPETP